MNETIDIPTMKSKLYEKLKPSGWAEKLRGFMLGNEFDQVLERLVKDTQEGKRFAPTLRYVFRAFEECPYNKTRVVFIGQDPYPYIGVPDGLAFSCSLKMRPEESLKFIFKEIGETVYNRDNYEADPDLIRWAHQGVLLLNSAFTVNIRHTNSHHMLWRPFLGYVLDSMVWNPEKYDTIFVFLGGKAQEYMDLVPDNFNKIKVSHPASAGYTNQERWNSGDLFNKINRILKEQGKKEIIW